VRCAMARSTKGSGCVGSAFSFRIVDAQGNDLPLKPGNSWFQIVSPDMKVTTTE
jgi:hypothetical protein